MASGTIKNRGWRHIGTQTKNNAQSIPSDCNEILVITKHGDNDWTTSMVIPKEYLSDTCTYLMMGSATMYVGLYAYATVITATSCKYNGVNASTWTTDYYVK